MKLSIEKIRELLDYDPEAGVLIWRERLPRKGLERIDIGWNKRFAGKIAGKNDKAGYIRIKIAVGIRESYAFASHRIAWAHYFGEWPNGNIDHINRVRSDNRISNLRVLSQDLNMMNTRMRVNNKSGIKGVAWRKQNRKWVAYISVRGNRIYLGTFDDRESAAAARQEAEQANFSEFLRTCPTCSEPEGHGVS